METFTPNFSPSLSSRFDRKALVERIDEGHRYVTPYHPIRIGIVRN